MPVDKNEENYPNDDTDDYLNDPKDDIEDDDYEEDNSKGSASSTQGSPAEVKEYITENYVEYVDAGSSTTLKCKGQDFEKDTLFMWFNETIILVQGQQVRERERITFDQSTGSITIKNVQASDDGNYRCRAFAKKNNYETNIQLFVNGPPSKITIGHNQGSKEDVSNQIISYKVGEKDLRFKCNPSKSHPEVKVTWNHNGNVIEPSRDHDISLDGSLLVFKNLHAKHAGRYECDASNDRGNIKAHFDLDVQCKWFV